MNISQNGINLIKKFEGVRLTAYWDSYGSVWTIGYGHTKGVYQGLRITQQQAEKYLYSDIKSHTCVMEKIITTSLTQNQYDALASFHFNLGANILNNDKVLLRKINNRKWSDVVSHIKQYCYSGGVWLQGLYNRRVAETELFMKDINVVNKPNKGGKIKMKKFTLKNDVYLRKQANVNSGLIVNEPLSKGTIVEFNDIIVNQGYMWGCQPRLDGTVGYIALGKFQGYGNIS